MSVVNLHMMKIMNKRNLILPAVFLFISACANDPYDSQQEINEACHFELQAALTAIKLRDKGKPKTLLLSRLTPLEKNSSRLLVNMYQIVDEVYANSWINKNIYSTYRFELCQRQLLSKPHPLTINPVLPALKLCQQQFATESSEKTNECISMAIGNNTADKN